MDIGLPNQAFKQVWNGQMILNLDGMCEWGPGNTVLTIKDGQTKGSVRRNYLLPRTTYFLFWLVGFQTTGKGFIDYDTKSNPRRRFNLMSQALMAPYFNDWLGWFYPGYSGFHPHKKIKDTKRD